MKKITLRKITPNDYVNTVASEKKEESSKPFPWAALVLYSGLLYAFFLACLTFCAVVYDKLFARFEFMPTGVVEWIRTFATNNPAVTALIVMAGWFALMLVLFIRVVRNVKKCAGSGNVIGGWISPFTVEQTSTPKNAQRGKYGRLSAISKRSKQP